MKNTIKSEFKELIKRRSIEGETAKSIKRELDQIYGPEVTPRLTCISTWSAYFKASARGKEYVSNPQAKRSIDQKYRLFIEKGVYEGKRSREIQKELWAKYGRNSVSPNTIRSWFRQFTAVADLSITSSQSYESNLNVFDKLSPSTYFNLNHVPEKTLEIKNEPLVKQEQHSLDVIENNRYNYQMSGNQTEKSNEEMPGVFFDHGLELDKILGDVMIIGVRFFLVKWKNCPDNHLCKYF